MFLDINPSFIQYNAIDAQFESTWHTGSPYTIKYSIGENVINIPSTFNSDNDYSGTITIPKSVKYIGSFGYNDGLNIKYKFLGETPPEIGTPMQRADNYDQFDKIDVPIDYYWEYKKAYNSWGNNLIWSSDSGVTTITTDIKSGLLGGGETFYIKGDWTLGYLAEQVKYAENKELYSIFENDTAKLLYILYTGLNNENYTYRLILPTLSSDETTKLITKNTLISLTHEIEQVLYDNQPSLLIKTDNPSEFPNNYAICYFPTDVSTIYDVYIHTIEQQSPTMFNALEFAIYQDVQTKIKIKGYELNEFKEKLKSNNKLRENWLSQYQYNGNIVFSGTFVFSDDTEATMTDIIGETTDKYVYIDGVKRYVTTNETTYEDLGVSYSVILEPETEEKTIQNHMDYILKTANINKLYEEYDTSTKTYLYLLNNANTNIKSGALIITTSNTDESAIYNSIKSTIDEPQNSIIILSIMNKDTINIDGCYILRLPNTANTIYDTNTTNNIYYTEYFSEVSNVLLAINDTQDSSNKIIIINKNTTDKIENIGVAGGIYTTYDLFKGKLRFNDGEYTIEELKTLFPEEE